MKLKQEHFYYGAILAATMEYNPDAKLVLLQPQNDTRRVYHIQTNTSQECRIFFKHAFEITEGSQRWSYRFSEADKELLKSCYDEKIPTFIYLLCGVKNLMNSEIAILRYEEFAEVVDKKNIGIRARKGHSSFYLHRERSPKGDLPIPRNRIEKSFNDLINDIVKCYNDYYCPNCGTKIKR